MPINIAQITAELIKIPSVDEPGNISELKKVIDWVKKRLAKLPRLYFTSLTVRGKPALIVTFSPNHKRPKLFLNGHLDVVPAGDNQFHPALRGDKLFGRGAHDMKGGCAVMIALIEHFARVAIRPDMGFMFVTDEESHGEQSQQMYKLGYRPELLITVEPTELDIVVETKGIIGIEGIIPGKSAHGSRPWLGSNPVENFHAGLKKLFVQFPPLKKERWRTTCVIGEVKSGTGHFNIIPPELSFKLDVRYLPGEDGWQIIKRVQKCFPASTVWKIFKCDPAHARAKDMRLIHNLKKVMAKEGIPAKFTRATYATDARFFAPHGISCAVLGTKGGNIHGAGEWVSVKSLSQLFKVLKKFGEQLD